MGNQGYPRLTIEYYGPDQNLANEVSISFLLEEGATVQVEKFQTKTDARNEEIIQSTIVKMIERSGAKTVFENTKNILL